MADTPAKKAPAPAKKTVAKKAAAVEKVTGDAKNVETADDEEPAPKATPKAPAVSVPEASSRSSGGPSRRVRSLQVMLADLGFYTGRVDGFYTAPVRNAVSALQQSLSNYSGVPHGAFDEATRTALLESKDYHTQS